MPDSHIINCRELHYGLGIPLLEHIRYDSNHTLSLLNEDLNVLELYYLLLTIFMCSYKNINYNIIGFR